MLRAVERGEQGSHRIRGSGYGTSPIPREASRRPVATKPLRPPPKAAADLCAGAGVRAVPSDSSRGSARGDALQSRAERFLGPSAEPDVLLDSADSTHPAGRMPLPHPTARVCTAPSGASAPRAPDPRASIGPGTWDGVGIRAESTSNPPRVPTGTATGRGGGGDGSRPAALSKACLHFSRKQRPL